MAVANRSQVVVEHQQGVLTIGDGHAVAVQIGLEAGGHTHGGIAIAGQRHGVGGGDVHLAVADLQGLLSKTAEYYDDEVKTATDSLPALMEPCIMLFLAVFVLIIVLSIFLPMMNMTKAYDQYL